MEPSTDWKEIVPEGEAERFERYAQEVAALQKKFAAGGKLSRGFHAKGQAGVVAELEVLPDLPEHARVGLFASPGKYTAYVRFSNGVGTRQPDAKPDVRGVAVKVVGVNGKKIIPGLEGAKTQDFLMIRTAAVAVRDADEFLSLVRAATRPALLVPILIREVGLGRAFGILKRVIPNLTQPMTSFATTRYYSAAPIQYGKYAVHYALEPMAPPDPAAKAGKSDDYLVEELAGRLRQGALVYETRVQFFRDETKTPIEDASVEWLERDAPFLTVARLTIPSQDLASPRGVRLAEWIETLSFDPWHALVELRPLGSIMRARNAAYRVSTKARGAAPEPDGSERFD